MQWTGCHGEERHGGDRLWRMHGQGVMVRRVTWMGVHCIHKVTSMVPLREVTEVVEDAMDSVSCEERHVRRDMDVTEVVEDAMDRAVMVRRDMEVTGCGGCSGQGVMVRRDMDL